MWSPYLVMVFCTSWCALVKVAAMSSRRLARSSMVIGCDMVGRSEPEQSDTNCDGGGDD